MPDAGGSRGGGKLRRRLPVDAVVKLRLGAAAGMRNAGQMDDLIHIRRAEAPQSTACEKSGCCTTSTSAAKGGCGGVRHRGTDRPPVFAQTTSPPRGRQIPTRRSPACAS